MDASSFAQLEASLFPQQHPDNISPLHGYLHGSNVPFVDAFIIHARFLLQSADLRAEDPQASLGLLFNQMDFKVGSVTHRLRATAILEHSTYICRRLISYLEA